MAAFIKSREFGGKFMLKKKNSLSSPPSYIKLSDEIEEDEGSSSSSHGGTGTPRGHVPVMVGMVEAKLKKFVVPTWIMKDPSILSLLQLSADEFGYHYQGVLQIPCHPEHFETILVYEMRSYNIYKDIELYIKSARVHNGNNGIQGLGQQRKVLWKEYMQ